MGTSPLRLVEPIVEMYIVVLVATVLALAAFVARLLPRLRRDPWLRTPFPLKGDTGDSMVHLIIADLIRRNGQRIFTNTSQFLLGRHHDYPSLFHKLAAYFPKHVLDRWDFVFTPAIDALHVALVFIGAWYLLDITPGIAPPLTGAALIAAGFALTPLFTGPHRRPAIGERPLGFLLANIYFFCLAIFAATGQWWAGALAVCAGSCAAATSKFAIQAMLFIPLPMALFTLDPAPLFVLGVTVVFAVIASGGYAVRVVRGLVRHTRFYQRELMHYQDYVRSFGDHMLASSLSHLLRGQVWTAWRELELHPAGQMLRWVPWLTPFILAAVWRFAEGGGFAVADTLFAWGFASLTIGVLTSLNFLKFLGEGFRYLEFGLFPMLVSVLLLPAPVQIAVWTVGLGYGLYFLIKSSGLPSAFDYPSAEAKELVDFLTGHPPTTIFAVPGRVNFPICYGTSHRAVWHLTNIDRGERAQEWAALFARSGFYPFPNPETLGTVRDRFGAEIIVMWKQPAVDAEKVWGKSYDLSPYPVLFENERFIVVSTNIGSGAKNKTGQPKEAAA